MTVTQTSAKMDFAVLNPDLPGGRKHIAFFRGQEGGPFHCPIIMNAEEAYELTKVIEAAFPDEFRKRRLSVVPRTGVDVEIG